MQHPLLNKMEYLFRLLPVTTPINVYLAYYGSFQILAGSWFLRKPNVSYLHTKPYLMKYFAWLLISLLLCSYLFARDSPVSLSKFGKFSSRSGKMLRTDHPKLGQIKSLAVSIARVENLNPCSIIVDLVFHELHLPEQP